MKYTTTAQVYAYGASLGNSTVPTNDTDVMDHIVSAGSRHVDHLCNQVLGMHTLTNEKIRAFIDVDNTLVCYPRTPQLTLTKIAYRTQHTAWRSVDVAAWENTANTFGTELRLLNQTFPNERYNSTLQVEITGIGGYILAEDIPLDVSYATTALCWYLYQKRSAPTENTAIPAMGVLTIPSKIPIWITELLRNHAHVIPA